MTDRHKVVRKQAFTYGLVYIKNQYELVWVLVSMHTRRVKYVSMLSSLKTRCGMKWKEARKVFPEQLLLVFILDYCLMGDKKIVDEVQIRLG